MSENNKYYVDLDGGNINNLINWRHNPLTTAQRLALSSVLTAANVGYFTFDVNLLQGFYWSGTDWVGGGGGGGGSWGSITGDIQNQTDLQNEFDAVEGEISAETANRIVAVAVLQGEITDIQSHEYVDYVASENISQGDPIIAGGLKAFNNNLSHRLKVIGLAKGDVSSGFAGVVISDGQIKFPGWSWAIGDRIFVGQGTLVNSPPSTGGGAVWSQEIGIATASDTIMVNLKQSILL